MVLHFFSELLILLDLLLEVTFKDFKALKDFCKEVDFYFMDFTLWRPVLVFYNRLLASSANSDRSPFSRLIWA